MSDAQHDSGATGSTDTLLDALLVEARTAGADPTVVHDGPWVCVLADERWLTELGYDSGPWRGDAAVAPRVVSLLPGHVERVSVITRSYAFHNPPLHNGCPPPPQVNSDRAVVAFIPRRS